MKEETGELNAPVPGESGNDERGWLKLGYPLVILKVEEVVMRSMYIVEVDISLFISIFQQWWQIRGDCEVSSGL